MMVTQANDLIGWIGRTASDDFLVTSDLIDQFAVLSGDFSPIHVDDGVARSRGFRQRVAHGALLTALVSCVLGMRLPGAAGTLLGMDLKFRRPCYAGDRVRITLRVVEAYPSVKTVILDVRVTNQQEELVCSGRVQSSVEECS